MSAGVAAAVERRAEGRRVPGAMETPRLEVPGVVVLQVVDVSDHGLCCRVATPLAPGRAGTVRVGSARAAVRRSAQVVRCEVCRLSADSVEYYAAWRLERGWLAAP